MNSLIRRVGFLQLQSQQVSSLQQRFYWKPKNINVYNRKPKVKTLHFKKAELMSVLKPYVPDPDEGKPMWETCENVLKPKGEDPPLTPYEIFLKSELTRHLEEAQLIVVVQRNPIRQIDQKRCQVYLGRKHMYPMMYTNRVVSATIMNTQYENLLRLFEHSTHFVFCKNPTFKDLLNIFKKYDQYVILGGFFEGRILTRANIEECAKLPSLDIVRAQFVNVLQSASAQLVRTLGSSQSMLLSHLDSRGEELKKDGPSASAPSEAAQDHPSSDSNA